MSETSAEPHVNGTAPAPAADEPCADCATPSEKIMAVVSVLVGIGAIIMGIDMFMGGRLLGFIQERVPQ